MNNNELQKVLGQIKDALPKNQLYLYEPYPKQVKFHHTIARERCFMAPNQTGKTIAGAAETAYHATGLYPNWWKGKRFEGGIKIWISGESGRGVRDAPQRLLFGMPDQPGTGFIPYNAILDIKKSSHGVQDLLDYAVVESSSPHSQVKGATYVYAKTYEQGRRLWQAESIEVVWFDEEPHLSIYTEGLARTNARDGITYLTFTPLLGMSEVVKKFIVEPTKDRVLCHMDITDAKHYSKEKIEQILASYPEHERDARGHGRPSLGSGAVYPVIEDGIKIDPFEIPGHWPRIAGMDFGWEHPTAVAWLAYDKDTDIIYVYDAYSQNRRIISHHASAIKGRGDWIPVAWPQDGSETEPRGGESIIDLYRKEGIKALPESARYQDNKGTSLEASVGDVLNRMQTGRFKVFRHLDPWWAEFRLYHRVDGKIVRKDDDLMSATRYAVMCLPYAITRPDYVGHNNYIPKRRTYGGRSFMSS